MVSKLSACQAQKESQRERSQEPLRSEKKFFKQIWPGKTDRTTGTLTNMQCFPCLQRFPLRELLTLINKGLAWTVVITFSLSLLHQEQCQRHKTERRTHRGHESLYINTHTGHWCAILTNTLEACQNDEKTGYMTWGRHFSTFEVCWCVLFSFYPSSYSVTIFFLLAWGV